MVSAELCVQIVALVSVDQNDGHCCRNTRKLLQKRDEHGEAVFSREFVETHVRVRDFMGGEAGPVDVGMRLTERWPHAVVGALHLLSLNLQP